MTKNLIIILIFIGIVLIAIGLTKATQQLPQQQIIYRYIPRSFEEEQEDPVMVSDIFRTMFSLPDPWIGSINDLDTRKKEAVNKYWISQI